MKFFFTALTCLAIAFPAFSQYYLRGEVRNSTGSPLVRVKITLFSKGSYPYYTGTSGTFGIPSSLKIDTVTLEAEGYETLKSPVETSKYSTFTLEMTSENAKTSKLTLSSSTKNLLKDKPLPTEVLGESYSNTVENDFVKTIQYPETGFAINVDRASYSNIRRFLNIKAKPPCDAVRIEEMLNYFNFRCKKYQQQQETFSVSTKLTSCPWNNTNQLLFINLQAKKLSFENTPPTNLVFLIDVSGSMDMHNRLSLLKSGFKLMAENLREKDTVSIVTYGSNVTIALPPTAGNNKQKIIEALEGLTPGGATAGEAAIRVAYRLAKQSFIKGGNNRVILATDGDFNVGQTSDKELEDLVTQQKQTGIYLTCLGVGMGNYKDSKLEALAKKGNGNFAYLDNDREAEKVLVEEFAQTLYTVANDVFLNVAFNNNLVKSYRLIGFDNRRDALENAGSELEGGEVGSGHSLLSVFEITPADKNNVQVNTSANDLAQLELSYRLPGSKENIKQNFKAANNLQLIQQADSSYRFAAAVVMFGSILKQSMLIQNADWEDVEQLAKSAASPGNLIQMEFLDLVEKAKKIYGKKRKGIGSISLSKL